jgi:hypothetical protein
VSTRRLQRRRGDPCGWMQEAECEKASIDVKYNMDTKVEDNTRLYKLQKSNFDREINTAVSSFINYSHGRFIILPVNFFRNFDIFKLFNYSSHFRLMDGINFYFVLSFVRGFVCRWDD